MPGVPELLIILLIVLLLFGAGKLPAIGDALGRTIKNFKRSATGQDELEVSKSEQLEEGKQAGQISDGSASHSSIEDAEVLDPAKKKPRD